VQIEGRNNPIIKNASTLKSIGFFVKYESKQKLEKLNYPMDNMNMRMIIPNMTVKKTKIFLIV
jgi:hypothetical protein